MKLRTFLDHVHRHTLQRLDDSVRLERVAPLRAPGWPLFRRQLLAVNSACAACGTTECLTVHHIKPFDVWPDSELDAANCLTLCEKPGMNCHLQVGHRMGLMMNGEWWTHNPRAAQDAQLVRNRKHVFR